MEFSPAHSSRALKGLHRQFAIGSTIYHMTKGHEVYGSMWFGDEHLVEVVGPTVDSANWVQSERLFALLIA